MRKKLIIPIIMSLVGLVGVQCLPTSPAWASPDCSAGATLNIIAHPDDDLFFMNPAIKQDIDAGKCVQTIVMTAGEGYGNDPDYPASREEGLGAAYVDMIGETDIDAGEDVTIAGHTARKYTFSSTDRVSLLFLRLPEAADNNANQGNSLKKLWQGGISSVTPFTSSWQTYSKAELIYLLRYQMRSLQADTVRSLNFTKTFDATDDHLDHIAAGLFAQAAHQDYTVPHQLVGYRGHDTKTLTDNVTGTDYTNKLNAYYQYDPSDYYFENGIRKSKCPDITVTSTCDDDIEKWVPRQYVAATQTRSAQGFITLDGDANAATHSTSDTGRTPAAVQFGSDIWTFYYDNTSKDLRYAKANSSDPNTWIFGALDTTGDVGQTPAAVVHGSTLHVFYYDQTNTNLRHAWLVSGGSWQFENMDGGTTTRAARSGNVDTGLMPTVTVYNGGLQLFYFEPGTQDLRHAWSNAAATSWSFETFDGHTNDGDGRRNAAVGYDPHVVVFNGMLHVFYYDDTTKDLRLSKNNPGWQFSVLDGNSTTDGRRNTALGLNPSAAVYGTSLQVVYYDQTNGDLRHAWYDGTTNWQFENLDGDVGAIGRHASNVGATPYIVNDNGTLHVFAYDVEAANKDLRHYWTSATQPWQAETVDGRGDDGTSGRVDNDAGEDPVALPFASGLRVLYYQRGSDNFRYASL